MKNRVLFLLAIFLALGCAETTMSESKKGNTMNYAEATFAGGCFWCMEPPFEKEDGVISVTSGYTGGPEKNPTYKQVSAGATGHVEAVKVVFDPERISYEKLLNIFWRSMDPTDDGGQFADRGKQYKTAIFYHSEEQKQIALKSKQNLESSKKFDKPIVTPIKPAGDFYNAEEYHQDYYKKDADYYKRYRKGSGREGFLDSMWKNSPMPVSKPLGYSTVPMVPKSERLKQLTPEQFSVTQKNGTEPPFKNEYWDNKKPGIYVDIVSGEPLFSSTHKYKSGTGWPSYFQPLEKENIVEVVDKAFGMTRIEVRSKSGDSHLGHLFDDGPKPTGQRYCINSASLRFIPSEDLEKEGYGKYRSLFEM